MIDQPLVSVILPCYNHEKFVEKSIQSVIEQTYKNIELIIIDDGSTDKSVEIIKDLMLSCSNRFASVELRYRENRGLSNTLNEALEWCSGDYISILASDDFYHKEKISKQIDFFLKNKQMMFVISKSYVVDDYDRILENQTMLYNSNINNDITFDDIFVFKTHLPVTGMYKIELIRNFLNGFDPNVKAEDYDIYLKIARITKINLINEELYYYRSPEALGGDRIRLPMRLDVSDSHLDIIQKYIEHPLYKTALLEWNYRRFIFYSSYVSTKIYAFNGMLRCLTKMNKIQFYKSLFKLIFVWK